MYPNCRVLECVPPATDELARGPHADLAAR
jgi:hypothetical protein